MSKTQHRIVQDPTRAASPIHHIPNEILWQIFVFLGDWNILDDHKDSSKWCMPGWPLTLVCARWRSIALRTPQLWSQIELSICFGADVTQVSMLPRCRDYLASVVQALLARSGTSPLRIRLTRTPHIEDSHPAVEALCTSYTRWHTLQIRDAEPAVPGKLRSLDQFRSLEVASLLLGDHDLQARFLSAPRLRAVQLIWECLWAFPVELAGLTFPQVKTLDLQVGNDWDLVMSMFPNVEYLCLHLRNSFLRPDNLPYTLPQSCRVLVLDEVDPELFIEQLQYFRAPKIDTLITQGYDIFPREFLTESNMYTLIRFQQESGCSLTYLAIKNTAMSMGMANALANMLQSEGINIEYCRYSDSVAGVRSGTDSDRGPDRKLDRTEPHQRTVVH